MLSLLKELVQQSPNWVEIRYHKRVMTQIDIRNCELNKANLKTLTGAGIRVLVDGCWGFMATSDLTRAGLSAAITEATAAARTGAKIRKQKITGLATGEIAKGRFDYVPGLKDPDLKEKIALLLQMDKTARNTAGVISTTVLHDKLDDAKLIVNSDGVEAEIIDVKQDIRVECVMERDGKRETGECSHEVTGSWSDLFARLSWEEMVREACRVAHDKLDASYAEGGQFTVILDPPLVGLLAHEAIGHTVEADFVLAGSVAKGKVGEVVASELINLVDEGNVYNASGMIIVDDEGTIAKQSVIIENGILREYLHSRESAEHFHTVPKGNARAFTYRDEPLIRMTNTFFLPGKGSLEEMIAGIKDGYFLKGFFGGGQADATGEFMFGVKEGFEIKDGKLGKMVKGITISGQAFEVLKSVDAVSQESRLGIGRGYCGKWQRAKTDCGGPYIRCRVTIGGQQE